MGSEKGKDEVQDSEIRKEVQHFWDNLLVQKMSLRCSLFVGCYAIAKLFWMNFFWCGCKVVAYYWSEIVLLCVCFIDVNQYIVNTNMHINTDDSTHL